MDLKCFVVDKDVKAVERLSNLIKNAPGLSLVGTETVFNKALEKLDNNVPAPDVLFVGLNKSGDEGISFCKMAGDNSIMIFVADSDRFYREAYEMGAVDYLTKPIKKQLFLRAIERARVWQKGKVSYTLMEGGYFFLKLAHKRLEKVYYQELLWVEAKGKKIVFHLWEKPPVSIYCPLGTIEAVLPKEDFARIHKSHLVNLNRLGNITDSFVDLDNGETLGIGPRYKESFFNKLTIL